MIRVVPCLLLLAWMAAGCAWFKSGNPSKSGSVTGTFPTAAGTNGTAGKAVVTPDTNAPPTGNVARVNTAGSFVVLNFPTGNLPLKGQRLYVYRQGLRVGEVRISGPNDGDNTVADIVAGEAQRGDEIRLQ
jgi:hypothetical protein